MASNEPVYVCFKGKYNADKANLGGHFYSTLQRLVVQQPGFISETPFVSVDRPGAQLLYVKFDNEQHMREWRNQRTHLKIESVGRSQMFLDYRIRIGHSVSDKLENAEGRAEGSASATPGQYLLIWQYPLPKRDGQTSTQSEGHVNGVSLRHLVDASTYINESHGLQISAWSSKEAAIHAERRLPRGINDEVRIILVDRDYGRFDRKEAPAEADESQSKASADETIVLPTA